MTDHFSLIITMPKYKNNKKEYSVSEKILNLVERASCLKRENSKNKKIKEWMTKDLLNSTQKVYELLKKFKKYPQIHSCSRIKKYTEIC